MRKVLYLINSLKNGGPVNMLYSLCKYLDNTQYKIYVMALKKCDINARDFSNLNCELIIINENNKLKRINKAFEEIKRISPDIIHSHGGLADWINVHTKNGSKKITTIHCDPDIDLIMKYGKVKGTIVANIFLHNLKRMDCPIACSETISNKIYENRKVKFDYIRNGIDPTMLVVNKSIKRSELKIEESDTVYAFCGYLSKRKNVKFLIEVFNTLPNNYKLLVIGDGDELVALKASAKKDNVIFVGKVSTPANYLQLSDYFISASLSEGLPIINQTFVIFFMKILRTNQDILKLFFIQILEKHSDVAIHAACCLRHMQYSDFILSHLQIPLIISLNFIYNFAEIVFSF